MSESIIDTVKPWTVVDAAELYETARWGKGYFAVNEQGNLQVHPDKDPARAIDLKKLIDRLKKREIALPILVRFSQILQHRMRELRDTFDATIEDHEYQGRYVCVYPIKVNQQRHVVEEVLRYGSALHFGLEAGSKPELLAAMAVASDETPIICNGFKDAQFIETVMLAQKMGRTIIPVIEKYTELEMAVDFARRVDVRPQLGVRVKLASRSGGRWQESGGYRSKFGLTTSELLRAVEVLRDKGMADCFKLLHFHLGSQIPNIRVIKEALTEAARMYAQLVQAGAGLEYLDVGGGLGVDYDGSQTNFDSSVNYTLEEYAADVVYHVKSVCEEASIPHPHLISESGRALVAYHSVLVFNVLGVSGVGEDSEPSEPEADAQQPLVELFETYENLGHRNALEGFHDASGALETAMNLFSGGYLSLADRGQAENLYWAICKKLQRLVRAMEYVPEELERLDEILADTYFCNFSLFQSMPDSWAVKQLFPVLPLHRLNERPTREAVLGDITCDSDGRIDRFIDRRDVRRTLRLHPFDSQPYYLGTFLVGAYQEILGDLHNLFGDTHAVHVRLDDDNQVSVEEVIEGDTVRDVLGYVEFDAKQLLQKIRADIETAIRGGRIDDRQAGRLLRFYEDGLRGYTYLEEPHER